MGPGKPTDTVDADQVQAVLDEYPWIFFACHTRHVRDPESGRMLSETQARILDHLDEIEPTSLTELAEHMGVTAGTMSMSIKRLARRGYVVRSRSPEDARRLELRLSPSGARVSEEHEVLDEERVRSLLERLGPEERETALQGLELLGRAARASVRAGRARGA